MYYYNNVIYIFIIYLCSVPGMPRGSVDPKHLGAEKGPGREKNGRHSFNIFQTLDNFYITQKSDTQTLILVGSENLLGHKK